MINVTTNYKGVSSDQVFDIAVMSLFLNKDRQSSVCKKGAKLWKGMGNGERRQQKQPHHYQLEVIHKEHTFEKKNPLPNIVR